MVGYMMGDLVERPGVRKKCGGGTEEEGLCGVHGHMGECGGRGLVDGKKGSWGEKMALLVGEGMASAVDGDLVEVGGGGGGARRRSAE